MLNFSRLKVALIFVPCLWAVYASIPHLNYERVERFNDAKLVSQTGNSDSKILEEDLKSWPNWLSSKIVNLGLDLRGGAHLLVEVSLEDVYTERLDSIWTEVRSELRQMRDTVGSFRRIENGVGSLKVQIQNQSNITDAVVSIQKLSKPIASLSSLNAKSFLVTSSDNSLIINLSVEEKKNLDERTMSQSLEIIRRRVDEAGTREPSIQRQGNRRILVQVPGIGSAEELLKLIGKTAKLQMGTGV